MRSAGLAVYTDAVGNVRGLLPGSAAGSRRLLIGSHLDTVPNAGAFDGPLGVLLGLALIEELAGEERLSYAIELIAFSEEEGVRFAKPFLGSLALIGELKEDLLSRTDASGTTIARAIRSFGLDPAEIPDAVAHPAAAAYLEFHIEQGPVLESDGLALGVVDAIAGQSRFQVTFSGQANHAGTTPMGALRRDALAAAAEWIAEVERYANRTPGLVATVGRIEARPGAGNVIAGECLATLDVRHADALVLSDAVQHLLTFASQCGAGRRVTAAHVCTLEQAPVPMDVQLTRQLAEAVRATVGDQPRILTSGAGHDAMIVARRLPSAMLFLRSPGGLSHHPDETVTPADVEAALAAGLEFLRILGDTLGTKLDG